MTLFCADIGTSSLKAGLVDETGRLLGFTRIPLPVTSSFPPEAWTDALAAACAELGGESVSGIVLSGHGPTLVPVDGSGTPLCEALFWNDGRNERLPDQPSFFLPKAAWLARHRPEVYGKTRHFLSCPEYLTFRLTGRHHTFVPSAEFHPFYWTSPSVLAYGLDPEKFPPFLLTGQPAGEVGERVSTRTGFHAGIPVFAGGSDFLMALLGTATVRPGRTCDRAGTSEGINHCSAVKVAGDRIRCLPHVIEGCYNIAGILSSTGRLFEWYRTLSGQVDRPYGEMLGEIEEVSRRMAASGDFTPLFFPSLHEGATWEFAQGMFLGLGAGHGKAELGRSVVLSLGFAVREAVEILESHTGRIDALRVSGGQAKNAIWNRMKADITGRSVIVPEIEDAELLGNACAGFFGLGLYASLVEASEAMFRVRVVYDPRPEEQRIYAELYGRYVEIYGKIRKALREAII